ELARAPGHHDFGAGVPDERRSAGVARERPALVRHEVARARMDEDDLLRAVERVDEAVADLLVRVGEPDLRRLVFERRAELTREQQVPVDAVHRFAADREPPVREDPVRLTALRALVADPD